MLGPFEQTFTSVGGSIEVTRTRLLQEAKLVYEQKVRNIEKNYEEAKLLQAALAEPVQSPQNQLAQAFVADFRRRHEPKVKQDENDVLKSLQESLAKMEAENEKRRKAKHSIDTGSTGSAEKVQQGIPEEEPGKSQNVGEEPLGT